MFRPPVATGVEQRHELARLRVKTGDVRSLVVIAVAARQRKVVLIAWAAVLASDDMLDMEADEPRRCLR
jgi:hypothetical protein